MPAPRKPADRRKTVEQGPCEVIPARFRHKNSSKTLPMCAERNTTEPQAGMGVVLNRQAGGVVVAPMKLTLVAMARLILKPGVEGSQVFELHPGTYDIGRRPDNRICIADGSVSGQHCRLVVDHAGATLIDLDSTNGTFVEGRPVRESPIQGGQRFRLGGVDLLFECDGTALHATEPNAQPQLRLETTAPTAEPSTSPASASARLRIQLPADGVSASVDQTVRIEKEPPRLKPPTRPAASNCKYHPHSPARWLCPKCGKSFCDLCVATRATPHGSAHMCRTCGVECSPLKVQLTRPVKPAFFQVMWGAFAYPFGKDGIVTLIGGSVLLAAFSILTRHISFLLVILLWACLVYSLGYFVAYLQALIQTTAMGESNVEWPVPTDFLGEILAPAFQAAACLLLSFAPAIGLFVWAARDGSTALAIGGMVAIGYGCLYFPMALLAVALFDSVAAVNPMLVIPSVGRVFLNYLVSCVLLAIVFGIGNLLSLAVTLLAFKLSLSSMSDIGTQLFIGFASQLVRSLFSLYCFLVGARMLGLLYWTNSGKLGWFERRPAR